MMIPDLNNVDAASLDDWQRVPPGSYLARIVDAEERRSRNDGREYISIKFEIEHGDYKGRWLFSTLHFSDSSLPFTKAKLEAIGYDTTRQQRFDPSLFVNRRARLQVEDREYTTTDGMTKISSDVKTWDKPGAEGARSGNDPLRAYAKQESATPSKDVEQPDLDDSDRVPF